jgi:hypothetical protein
MEEFAFAQSMMFIETSAKTRWEEGEMKIMNFVLGRYWWLGVVRVQFGS